MFPVAFEIPWFGGGTFPIHTYGIMLALAFAAGLAVSISLAKASGISSDDIGDITLAALVSGLVGGRLLFAAVEWDQFSGNPLSIIFRRDGFVFYGGLLLAIPVTIFFIKRRGLRILPVADILAPALALGHSIGRLGCFAQGCCYGAPSRFGLVFPPSSPVAAAFGEVPVHPTQLYESILLLVVFGILIYAKRKRSGGGTLPLFDGAVFILYLACYAVIRFGIEFLRADDRGFYLGPLSISQLISIGIFVAAGVLYFRVKPQDDPVHDDPDR